MAKIYKGIPYTGTLPAVLAGTKAGYLHRYKVYGNMEQTGTPTPENPIVPSECGERTRNLFDAEKIVDDSNNTSTYIYGDYLRFGTGANPMKIKVNANSEGSYTISFDVFNATSGTNNLRFNVSYDDGTTEATPNFFMYDTEQYKYTFTTNNNKKLLSFETLNTYSKVTYIMINTAMLNTGSAALPYEPHGYKLPLLSGSTPVDIYIGDEPLRKIGDYADYIDYGTGKIVRQVGKVVLKGTETINGIENTPYDGTKAISYTYSNLGMTDIINYNKTMVSSSYPSYGSTHFVTKSHGRNSWTDINDGEIGANGYAGSLRNVFLIFGTSYQTEAEFKQFLADQYANGTPVAIWYPLETSTEEDPPVPFPAIPTSANSTTISWAGEGLAPSLFDSIAEWVSAVPKIYTNGVWEDAQTYTYTNGEWVADTQ